MEVRSDNPARAKLDAWLRKTENDYAAAIDLSKGWHAIREQELRCRIVREKIMEDFIEDEEIKGAKKDAKSALGAIKTILVKLISSTIGRIYRVLVALLSRFG